jgi:hypothetical protein
MFLAQPIAARSDFREMTSKHLRVPHWFVLGLAMLALAEGPSVAGAARFQFAGTPIDADHVCILIDRSRPMGGKEPSPASVAAELTASLLGKLAESDRFTLIAYRNTAQTFGVKGEGRSPAATAAHRQAALTWLSQIPCEHAAEHYRGVAAADQSGADVVFYFTTGSEPSVSNLELRKLTKPEDGGPKFMVVELGWGDAFGPPKFTNRLAEQSGGKRVYLDLLTRGQPPARNRPQE